MSRKDTALKYFTEMAPETRKRISEGIERNRKNDAGIVIRSEKPLPEDITVEIEQVGHEFKFGANLFMLEEFDTDEKNRIYKEKFAEVFNLATLPFYWCDVEPERGQYRFDVNSPHIYRRPAIDLCMDYCAEKGIEPKCHCLNYDSFTPKWLYEASKEEVKEALEERFRVISERYASRIPSFEVTNETLVTWHRSAFFNDPMHCEWSFELADKYFPNNHLIINDFSFWQGNFPRNPYYMQIERLLRNGISHLDSIGFQYHGFFPLEEEEKKAEWHYNPEYMLALFDLFADFGKKEQITEITLPAYGDDEENEWVQAELLRNTYSLFFSHPNMEAAIYWNLADGYAAFAPLGDMSAGENKYYGGLLRFDLSEKPAFRMLRDLIHKEWHTSLRIKAQEGKAAFRGFCGDYKIRLYAGGKEYEFERTLRSGQENQFILEI